MDRLKKKTILNNGLIKYEYSRGHVRYKNKEGLYHREDGPAIIGGKFGDEKYWYFNGKLHREDGPAVIEHGGNNKEYYKHGKLHRENGPAIIRRNTYGNPPVKKWFIDGIKYSEKEFNKKMGINNIQKNESKIINNVKKIVLNDKVVYKNDKGQFHREDGPAVITQKNTSYWFKNGKLHREDGPAVIYKNGTVEYYKNNLKHREDGPAVIYADGDKRYYLNGEQLTEEEFNTQKQNESKIYTSINEFKKYLHNKSISQSKL